MNTVDLTPENMRGKLTEYPDAELSYCGATEAYFVSTEYGLPIGGIELHDDGWHIKPSGHEEYPMRPDDKNDAAWLLLKFRGGITPAKTKN